MGRWFVEFLTSQGSRSRSRIPGAVPAGVARVDDWRKTDLKHDYMCWLRRWA